jgi:hypothetical protein
MSHLRERIGAHFFSEYIGMPAFWFHFLFAFSSVVIALLIIIFYYLFSDQLFIYLFIYLLNLLLVLGGSLSGGKTADWEGINSGRAQDGFSATYNYLVTHQTFAALNQYLDWYA